MNKLKIWLDNLLHPNECTVWTKERGGESICRQKPSTEEYTTCYCGKAKRLNYSVK